MKEHRGLKCAVLSYGEPGASFRTVPRGTYAYIHFLERFGHQVMHADRTACRYPGRLLRTLRTWKPDVVLAQHVGAMLAVFWRRLGKLSCPVVHAWDDYYDEQSRLPTWAVRPIEKFSVVGADEVTSVSRFNVHRAATWGRSATFIPHGVEADQCPGTLVLDSARVRVVYLGDQAPYKGMRGLMDAMRGVDADLFMVGTINPDLQEVAPPNVRFVGRVPSREVQSVLRQADVLVNPSDQDSNFKLQEYIRAGKPILGVRGRMAWAFDHGKNAWLADDLREGMILLKDSSALRARLAEGVKTFRILTWQEAVRELETVLFSAVEMARRGGM